MRARDRAGSLTGRVRRVRASHNALEEQLFFISLRFEGACSAWLVLKCVFWHFDSPEVASLASVKKQRTSEVRDALQSP